jgi:hypothetical protein
VWTPQTRRFYPVETFDEMQEPDISSNDKTITSVIRDVNDIYIETYKWKNGKLVKVSTKKESLF